MTTQWALNLRPVVYLLSFEWNFARIVPLYRELYPTIPELSRAKKIKIMLCFFMEATIYTPILFHIPERRSNDWAEESKRPLVCKLKKREKKEYSLIKIRSKKSARFKRRMKHKVHPVSVKKSCNKCGNWWK
jgi:hypothetical protein